MAETLAKPKVWTSARKWQGNLIPLLFWLPPTAYGLFRMVKFADIESIGIYSIGAGVILGWFATNWAGSAPNRKMAAELRKILRSRGVDVPNTTWMVGFATPKYSSAIDPHEDIGFLLFTDGALRFLSETRSLELAKIHVKRVRFRGNVHSWVGLGRWVSVEGEVDGSPVRLLLEPRTRGTMVGNLRASRRLADKIRQWAGLTKG